MICVFSCFAPAALRCCSGCSPAGCRASVVALEMLMLMISMRLRLRTLALVSQCAERVLAYNAGVKSTIITAPVKSYKGFRSSV
jgi:hypothetical protein